MQPTPVELGRNSCSTPVPAHAPERLAESLPDCEFYWLVVINASFLLINNLRQYPVNDGLRYSPL